MRSFLGVLAVLIVFSSLPGWADEPPAELAATTAKSQYVDLDGDGLNDNIADQNHDGIPDFEVNAPLQPRLTMRGATTDIFSHMKTVEVRNTLSLSHSNRFRQLEFCTRSLAQCRGGFSSGDEFGPGNGMGQGTMSGNCAGGVCRR